MGLLRDAMRVHPDTMNPDPLLVVWKARLLLLLVFWKARLLPLVVRLLPLVVRMTCNSLFMVIARPMALPAHPMVPLTHPMAILAPLMATLAPPMAIRWMIVRQDQDATLDLVITNRRHQRRSWPGVRVAGRKKLGICSVIMLACKID